MYTDGTSDDLANESLVFTGTENKERTNKDMGELAQEYGQKIADKAGLARDFVAEKLSVATDKFKDLQGKDLSEVANEAKDYAKKNPGQVIVAAAAAGFLLGLLVKAGRR